jgi:hypothetical protein
LYEIKGGKFVNNDKLYLSIATDIDTLVEIKIRFGNDDEMAPSERKENVMKKLKTKKL